MISCRKGQIWIETVLYTIIGLAIIALVLSYVYPRIQSAQEKIIVEQTIEALNKLDYQITKVQELGVGNQKIYSFAMKRGKLTIDASNDVINFTIGDLKSQYSEPSIEIQDGRVKLMTLAGKQSNMVVLTLSYRAIDNPNIKLTDLQVSGREGKKEYTQAATPYQFSIQSKEGIDPVTGGRKMYVTIDEVSGA